LTTDVGGVASTKLRGAMASGAVLGRREAYLWAVVCLLANQAVQLIDASSFGALASSLADQNYIYWLTCYVVIYRVWVSDRAAPAARTDLWLLAAYCLATLIASFVPYRFTSGMLATLTAAYFLAVPGADRNVRAAGCVLLALSTQLVWAAMLFQFFTPELLPADAQLVGAILDRLRPDIVHSGTTFDAPDGHAIMLIGGCSSFNNLSIALLACVSVIMFTRTEWVRRDFLTFAIACGVMISLNVLRIVLLCWSVESYAFWHNAQGAPLFATGQTVIVLLIAWWGAVSGKRAA
jgi:exosortase/archaeosortase family protein